MATTDAIIGTKASPIVTGGRVARGINRLILAEWLLLIILLAALLVGGFWRGWRTLSSEFPNNYLVARLHYVGIPVDRVYEWTWLQRQNDRLGVRDGLVSFAPNPPTVELPILPLAGLSPLGAKRVWLIANLGFLALALWMLHEVTTLGWRRVLLIALLCILPLQMTFRYGRYYVLVLMLICAAHYALQRGWNMASGLCIAIAAAMKLFPALFVILFLLRRNWRALAGFVVGVAGLTGASLLIFGAEVHRVFLYEVVPQISRGDWIAPYYLPRGTFITLWSRLFLREPELNPSPWIHSPLLYALAQALTTTVLVMSFVIVGKQRMSRTSLPWAAMVPLVLLVCSTAGDDYPCLLIFTTILACGALWSEGNRSQVVAIVLIYVVVCAPIPERVVNWFPLLRLLLLTALYLLLLSAMKQGQRLRIEKRWWLAGAALVLLLALANLRSASGRDEDYARRLTTNLPGYRAANPVATQGRVYFADMQPHGYAIGVYDHGQSAILPQNGEAFSLAASANGPLYSEVNRRDSEIVRILPPIADVAEKGLFDGQEPALSPNGQWIAFIREKQGRNSAWLASTVSPSAPQMLISEADQPLELTVDDDGNVIASGGKVSDPRLLQVNRATGQVKDLSDIAGPGRYPAISPDGRRLAYSRRDKGFWHVVVHTFANGTEQQVTHGSCNMTGPFWRDGRTLLYATDCGRGVGLNSIAQVELPD